MEEIRTIADIERGIEALTVIEPRFARFIDATGTPPLRRAEGGFRGLLLIVTEQQVSLASAAAIWGRMCLQLDPMTPEHIGAMSDDTLRAPGLSAPKIRTVRALCAAYEIGNLDFDRLAQLPDGEVFDTLTAIKGIGPWTAEVYLLACLGRRDVWPAGDVALQVAAEAAFELAGRPDVQTMRALAEPWQPWRAVAARVLWSYYRVVKGLPAAV
jgi:DNA-3-methyladenine glycosylase II